MAVEDKALQVLQVRKVRSALPALLVLLVPRDLKVLRERAPEAVCLLVLFWGRT